MRAGRLPCGGELPYVCSTAETAAAQTTANYRKLNFDYPAWFFPQLGNCSAPKRSSRFAADLVPAPRLITMGRHFFPLSHFA